MDEANGRPSFIADAMLGRLAKSLRMLGYDTLFVPHIEDADLKHRALRDRRVLLTRDHEVAESALPIERVLVESDRLEDQLRQVVAAFDLDVASGLFTRCIVCNAPVEPMARERVRGLVPSYVFETQARFVRCPECKRIYWPATHVERARSWLGRVFPDAMAPAEGNAASLKDAAVGGPGDSGRAVRKNLFVTGRPGVGKTTLIHRVLEDVAVTVGGFTTSEIREAGRRVGFTITDLAGPEGVLAHVDRKAGYRVGRYGVSQEALERVGVPALRAAVDDAELVVMDEIGRMELCSEAFREAVAAALDSPRAVLGTIQDRSNAFLDAVRRRGDVEVVRVTEGNREAARTRVLEKIERILASRASG